MPPGIIDANNLRKWLDNDDAILVDVREPAEYAHEYIPGAILIPLATISAQPLFSTAGKKIVIHCHSGIRSRQACQILFVQNPELELYNLEGGITAWKNAGNQVKTSGNAVN